MGGAGPVNPSQSAISQWDWGFHTIRGVLTRGTTVFVPGSSELKRYGYIYDPTMRRYPPRVALAPRTQANQRSATKPHWPIADWLVLVGS